jgi:hypothetical protein
MNAFVPALRARKNEFTTFNIIGIWLLRTTRLIAYESCATFVRQRGACDAAVKVGTLLSFRRIEQTGGGGLLLWRAFHHRCHHHHHFHPGACIFGPIVLFVFVLGSTVAREEFSYLIVSHAAVIALQVHNMLVCGLE